MKTSGDPAVAAWTVAVASVAEKTNLPTALQLWTEGGVEPPEGTPPTPEIVARVYEQLIDALQPRGRRKRKGSYFTPPAVAKLLVDHVVEPIFQSRDTGETICQRTLFDPSCGTGSLLVAAASRIVDIAAQAGLNSSDEWQVIVQSCIRGVDLDPNAVLLARWSLWLASHPADRRLSSAGPDWACGIQVGDGLFDPTERHDGPFDVVLGNPPFANAIEGLVARRTKAKLADAFPHLGGTADLSSYFLARAHELAKPDGAVGLVLPRTVLSAPAVGRLRERLLNERPPSLLFAPDECRLFPGANVFVTLVGLHRGTECVGGVSQIAEPALRSITVDSANWWRSLSRNPSREGSSGRVGDLFHVSAGMTTGQAYNLRPFVVDDPQASGMRLVNTGLIEPGRCDWGTRTCRYLGRDFLHPVVVESAEMPTDLRTRLERQRRPKVVVAGLSTRVEAFLDAEGLYLAAVSTFTLFHPDNDLDELARLCRWLNSDVAADHLHAELGATAMGGGRITLTKAFLSNLPWPGEAEFAAHVGKT